MSSVKWQNFGYSLTEIASLWRFCAKPTKTKTKPGKRKELCRNEFLSYGVKLEEDVDFSSQL